MSTDKMNDFKDKKTLTYLCMFAGTVILGIFACNTYNFMLTLVAALLAIVLGVLISLTQLKKGILKFLTVSAFMTVIVFMFDAGIILPQLGCAREKAKRISCASNLKQIGLVLKHYAIDNDGWFPDKDGAAGFEQLRSEEYLSDYKVYICPTTNDTAGAGNQLLTENLVSYVYKGGFKDTPENAEKPLVWDKPTNHQKFGNILYCDGHVSGITAVNWLEVEKE